MTFKQSLAVALLSGTLGILGIIVGYILNERVSNFDIAQNCREEFRFLADSKDVETIDEAILACPAALTSLAERKKVIQRAKLESARSRLITNIDGSEILLNIQTCESPQCKALRDANARLEQSYQTISRRLPLLQSDLEEAIRMRDNAVAGKDGTGIAICGPICASAQRQIDDISNDLDLLYSERDEIFSKVTSLKAQATIVLKNEN